LDELAAWASVTRNARPEYRSLSTAEARQLAADGKFQIGAHTLTHPTLPAHTGDFQEREIRESKNLIESTLDRAVSVFAYPYGDYTKETVGIVSRIGFSEAFTTREWPVTRRANPLEIPRYMVGDWGGDQFARKLTALL
jgi:peptidoglycan/xylan/chitin deacetylase (PgdA/CDA1 family)